jgi:hypothetical protein
MAFEDRLCSDYEVINSKIYHLLQDAPNVKKNDDLEELKVLSFGPLSP